jgi:hypothetical protein
MGVNTGMNNLPNGQSSPLGAKFTPGGSLTPGVHLMLLKTGLSCFTTKAVGEMSVDELT